MQTIVTGNFPFSPPLPEVVTLSMSVLQLQAMMAQDNEVGHTPSLPESLISAATECVQDYIQQVGRFSPRPPAAPPPMTIVDTGSLSPGSISSAPLTAEQQISLLLKKLMEGNCGR